MSMDKGDVWRWKRLMWKKENESIWKRSMWMKEIRVGEGD